MARWQKRFVDVSSRTLERKVSCSRSQRKYCKYVTIPYILCCYSTVHAFNSTQLFYHTKARCSYFREFQKVKSCHSSQKINVQLFCLIRIHVLFSLLLFSFSYTYIIAFLLLSSSFCICMLFLIVIRRLRAFFAFTTATTFFLSPVGVM